jgi:thiol-disulfide isomerase/thioredoxin
MTLRWFVTHALLPLALALPHTAVAADRVRVFSLQGLDGGDPGDQLATRLLSVSGVHGARFDLYRCELTLQLGTMITDAQVVRIVSQAGPGWRAIPGPGQGRYLPPLEYPRGADVAVLTRDGTALGPLEKLRVPGRTTIFDAYADWCVSCRPMDEHVRAFVRTHPEVAVRKLNLARWDSPLAKEFGSRLTALPHLVIFTPDGRRHEFDGATWEQVAKAMRWR